MQRKPASPLWCSVFLPMFLGPIMATVHLSLEWQVSQKRLAIYGPQKKEQDLCSEALLAHRPGWGSQVSFLPTVP